jgi:hypothetical protein
MLQQIMCNVLVIWLPWVSHKVVHHVLKKSVMSACLHDSRNFQIWITHELTNLTASKNTCFQLIEDHSAKVLHIYLKLTPSCSEPVRNASWYAVS